MSLLWFWQWSLGILLSMLVVLLTCLPSWVLAGDVVKIIIAALIIPGVWRLCGNKASGSQQ